MNTHETIVCAAAHACFGPRGAARLLAIGLSHEVRRRGMDRQRVMASLIDACEAHYGQLLSADNSPYILHPIQVAILVSRWGGSEDDIIAALKHDSAEDGPDGVQPTLQRIEGSFGSPIRTRVLALTKDPRITDRQARSADVHRRLLQALPQIGPGLAAIKLADRAHNTHTCAHLAPERIQRLTAENRAWYAPLAHRVGAHALAAYLAADPANWHALSGDDFVESMLKLQPAWLDHH